MTTMTIERVRAFNGLDVLEGAFDPRAQINTAVEREAHVRAAVGLAG
jgi:hypothetical protein